VFYQDVFNVKDYGAMGNDSVDDTPSIAAAIAAANSSNGGVIYFPSGNYRVTSITTALLKPLIFAGDGLATVIISYSASTTIGCLDFTSGDPVNTVTIRDMTITCRASSMGIAISFTTTHPSYHKAFELTLLRLRIVYGSQAFVKGVLIKQVNNLLIDGCYFEGWTNSAKGNYGVYFDGQCVNPLIVNSSFSFWTYGIYSYATTGYPPAAEISPQEGMAIANTQFIVCQVGVKFGSAYNQERVDAFIFMNCNMDIRSGGIGTDYAGVMLENCMGAQISNNYIVHETTSYALDLRQCWNTTISNNNFFNAGSMRAIILRNAATPWQNPAGVDVGCCGVVIAGNAINSVGGVYLESFCMNCLVVNNLRADGNLEILMQNITNNNYDATGGTRGNVVQP
jgi:hypothetical protein